MIVLDCSAVLTLCFEDEEYAEKLLQYFSDNTATAPKIWPLATLDRKLIDAAELAGVEIF